jgi:hypothetical protein
LKKNATGGLFILTVPSSNPLVSVAIYPKFVLPPETESDAGGGGGVIVCKFRLFDELSYDCIAFAFVIIIDLVFVMHALIVLKFCTT